MKEIYEYDVYKLANKLSDKIWYEFDNWDNKIQRTIGYQIIRSAEKAKEYKKIIDELDRKLNAFIYRQNNIRSKSRIFSIKHPVSSI